MGGMKAAACLQRYDDEDQVTEEAMQLHHATYVLLTTDYFFCHLHFNVSKQNRGREEARSEREREFEKVQASCLLECCSITLCLEGQLNKYSLR